MNRSRDCRTVTTETTVSERTWMLHSLNDTAQLGRSLSQQLFPGAVIALTGPLGAGKTHLVRFIAEGLEVTDPDAVNSPTFVLVQEYEARLPIFHFDAYRLQNVGEFYDLGAYEYLDAGGVCLIEWADRVREALPPDRLDLHLEILAAESRSLQGRATGRHADRLAAWFQLP